MDTKEQIVFDVIRYADGSTETVYYYDINADDLFRRETTRDDEPKINRIEEIDAMPDQAIALW